MFQTIHKLHLVTATTKIEAIILVPILTYPFARRYIVSQTFCTTTEDTVFSTVASFGIENVFCAHWNPDQPCFLAHVYILKGYDPMFHLQILNDASSVSLCDYTLNFENTHNNWFWLGSVFGTKATIANIIE